MSTPPAVSSDRRRFTRIPLCRPVKWQDARGGRYHSARSRDVSAGGMLLEMAAPVALRPGQALRVTVPGRAAPAVIHDAALTDARVVRVSSDADGWRAAVAFTRDAMAA